MTAVSGRSQSPGVVFAFGRRCFLGPHTLPNWWRVARIALPPSREARSLVYPPAALLATAEFGCHSWFRNDRRVTMACFEEAMRAGGNSACRRINWEVEADQGLLMRFLDRVSGSCGGVTKAESLSRDLISSRSAQKPLSCTISATRSGPRAHDKLQRQRSLSWIVGGVTRLRPVQRFDRGARVGWALAAISARCETSAACRLLPLRHACDVAHAYRPTLSRGTHHPVTVICLRSRLKRGRSTSCIRSASSPSTPRSITTSRHACIDC